ncbi:MAG: DUF4357 domain-containing protein [Synergistaceae bacterium]|nr:DUF4357 domain-containing protein [Synergistaceae bacterium]
MIIKAINCLLIENEIIVATITGWHGQVFKITREKIENLPATFPFYKDLSTQGGIYFLIGDGQIYVGQADISPKGTRSILTRVFEHNKDKNWNEVNEIIMITSSVFSANDLNYLENKYFNKIKTAGVLQLNQTEPHLGAVKISTQIPMENFIQEVENIFTVMGINFLNPQKQEKQGKVKESRLLHLKTTQADAQGLIKENKFIVLKGSYLSLKPTESCPNNIKNSRKQYSNKIKPDGELLEDIPFDSPSGASSFVCFSSTNGYNYWKYEDGTFLEHLE